MDAPATTARARATSGAARQSEFQRRKEQILASLDRSPKGSLDAPVVDFLSWLNSQPSIVTTSSCSGRIAVFLGSSDPSSSKGGEWLLISHEALGDPSSAWAEVQAALHNRDNLQGTLASLLLEPFVLHAECADIAVAQRLLELAREVGFRESGLSLGRRRVMIQIRSLALRLEVPLAVDGQLLGDGRQFEVLVGIANKRLAENGRRVARLWELLQARLGVTEEAVEGQGEVPWVLACTQALAKAVKLALEDRGWLDESRRMAPLQEEVQEGQPARVGIPLTEVAATALLDEPAPVPDSVVNHQAEDASAMSANPQAADSAARSEARVEAKAGKAKRPPVVAADLLQLWSQSRTCEWPLSLRRSDVLPRKERPQQRGAPAVAASQQETSAMRTAVLNVNAEVVRQGGEDRSLELVSDLQELGQLQWRGDAALLPRGRLCGGVWEGLAAAAEAHGGLWEPVRAALGARLLARQQEIRVDDEVRGGAVEILAGKGSGWVVVPGPKDVRYTLDITRCMFSEGNAAEKVRVADWPLTGQTVLDLYAGIGFWTLPMLAAGAEQIFSCEWNPNALEALRRGLDLLGEPRRSRCCVLAGDNRRQEVRDATGGRCDRVLLGLIPTCRDGFPVATAALREQGGLLHVHWNVSGQEEEEARVVMRELEGVLKQERGQGWRCSLEGVQRIKWFAPRVRHVRIDVRCLPPEDAA